MDINERLCLSVKSLNIEQVEHLLNQRADVDVRDVAFCESNKTPLMHAVVANSPELVNKLIQAKANINAKDDNDWMALSFALFYGHIDLVRVLLEANARVDNLERYGYSNLMFAVDRQDQLSVGLLLDARADIDLHGEKCLTPIMLAVKQDNVALAKLLLEANPNFSIKDVENKTVFDYARENEELLVLLSDNLSKRINSNNPSEFEQIFQQAVICDQVNAVKLLIASVIVCKKNI